MLQALGAILNRVQKNLDKKISEISVWRNIPNYAEFYQSSATVGTYYTALNITSGEGRLTYISVDSNYDIDNFDIRITIDGVATVLSPGTATYAVDAYKINANTKGTFLLNLEYTTSLKVEAKMSESGWMTIVVGYET